MIFITKETLKIKSGQYIAVASLKLSLKLNFYLLANIAYNIFSPHFGKFPYSGHCGMLHTGSLPGGPMATLVKTFAV